MKETYPLQWPEGWPRTRIQDRETRTAWKKTEKQYIDALDKTLRIFDAISPVITRKDPSGIVGAPDSSVAVYFSRQREDDFEWQGALGISNPDPKVEEIEAAFRKLAAQHHPDRGGDIETFHALSLHKKNALAYISRRSGQSPEYVIACDKFKEVRHNVNAIRMTIESLRQMERDGTSRLLERAMTGFAALTAKSGAE